jgi:hypothetical protein
MHWAVDMLSKVVAVAGETRTGVHVCRGNGSRDERTLLSGGYAPVAAWFAQMPVTRLVPEYATRRAGDLITPGGKELGLGVVNPRSDEVEDTGQIVARVREALRVVPAEKLLPESRLWVRHVRRAADQRLRRGRAEAGRPGRGRAAAARGVSTRCSRSRYTAAGSQALRVPAPPPDPGGSDEASHRHWRHFLQSQGRPRTTGLVQAAPGSRRPIMGWSRLSTGPTVKASRLPEQPPG